MGDNEITILSMPTTYETVSTLLKHDEEIICTNAIVTIDSKGEIAWCDKSKMTNIICENNL